MAKGISETVIEKERVGASEDIYRVYTYIDRLCILVCACFVKSSVFLNEFSLSFLSSRLNIIFVCNPQILNIEYRDGSYLRIEHSMKQIFFKQCK